MKLSYQAHTFFTSEYYTEGPCRDAAGNLFVTTLTGGTVLCMHPDGQLSDWASSSCPNGQLILPGGDHLVCDSREGCIIRFSTSGKYIEKLFDRGCAGRKVEVPNDLTTDKAGNLYFTDSIRYDGCVYCRRADGSEYLLAEHLDYPNGIAFSPDEEILYVAESYQNRVICLSMKESPAIVRYINLPAHPSGKAENNIPDGLAVNSAGILSVAHYGMNAVQFFDSNGTWIGRVDTGLRCTSNVYFITDDHLMVTGGHGEPGPGAVLSIIFSIT